MAGSNGASRRKWLWGGALGSAGALSAAAAVGWQKIPRGFLQQYAAEFSRPILEAPKKPNPKRWPDKGLHAAWLGHSTVLVKIDDFTFVTDPVLFNRVGINVGPITFGLKRLVAPALTLEELPKIDLVLLSHAHMDHFDIPTLRELENKSTAVVTARGTIDLLRPDRYRKVDELGWGESIRIGSTIIQALEVKHWGARYRTDTWRGYNGYVIDSGKWRVLFAGDTAGTRLFKSLNGKAPELALFPIGAYNPWRANHCTPEEAWMMADDARAEFRVPVHHQTFQLSKEPFSEPVERFREAARNRANLVALDEIGGEFNLT